MKKPKPFNLTKTAVALAVFDAVGDAFDGNPSATNIAKLEEARLELAHAFADDTADRNDRATVLGFMQSMAGMTFVRRLVATFAAWKAAA